MDNLKFLIEIDLALFDFQTVENFSGIINAEFVLEGNETEGYNIVLKSNSVNLSSWGDLGGLPGYISELFINDDIIAYIPDINLSLTDITPNFFTEAFNLGTPPISSDNESVYLNFNAIGDRFVKVANKLLIPNSTPVTNEGDVYHLENSSFVPYNSGFEFAWDLNSNHTIKPEDAGIDYDGDNNHYKYDRWEDDDEEPEIRTLTVSADYDYLAQFNKSHNVNFTANYEGSAGNFGNINISGNNYTFPKSEYIFASPLSEPVSVSSNFTYNNNNYVFLSWSDGNTSTTRNISPSSPLSLTANYKGTQLSNNSSAYSNNSQRKIIRSNIGQFLISIYESMGKIWLEMSEDGGTTWELLNDGKPINGNSNAKNPSICLSYDHRRVGIVFQEEVATYLGIRLMVADIYGGDFDIEYDEIIYTHFIGYSYNSNPVITSQDFSNNGVSKLFFVTWNVPNLGFETPGLHYLLVKRIPSGVYVNEANGIIPNTNSNSHNPCIASNLTETSVPEFHLAWQQDGSSGVSSIKYCKISVASNYDLSFPNYSEPSAGRYAINYNPSIAITLNRPRVSWLTKHPVTLISEAALRTYGSYWSPIKAYSYSGGDNVESVSINNRNTEYGLVMAYGGDGREIRYTKGFTTTYEASPTQNNKDVQVSNGDDFTDMFISSLKTSSSPYLFEFNQIDESLNKSSSTNSSVGRSANITSSNSLFYCTLKDVVVDGEQIAFVEIPEEEKEISADKLMNEYLETEGFELKDKTDFTFKLSSGSTMDQETNKLLTSKNYVNFIVELVDAKEDKLIETLDKISFDELNTARTEEKSFQINTDNIKINNVKVRLRIEKSIDCNFTIADVISDKRELPKEGYINLDLKNNQIITEYKLNQNYPNPFNPVTTISYQIPTDGFVTLKVYNVLGKEVANLVNEQKTSGRYNIQFDGSNLSSGIYFYKISAGAYTATKKLMLMK